MKLSAKYSEQNSCPDQANDGDTFWINYTVKHYIKSHMPWLARALNTIRGQSRSSSKSLNPNSAKHAEAWKWFEARRSQYDQLVDAIAPRLHHDCTFYDVGANVGFFSKLLMDRLHFQGQAHLFEPVPHLAELCRTTFAHTRYHVTIHNVGLGEQTGTTMIHTATDGNIGWNTLIAEKADVGMTAIPIQICRLDEMNLPSPNFIKIDVEGAEYLVLRGMLHSLRRAEKLPLIVCEVGWGRSHPQFTEIICVIEELEMLGYKVQTASGSPVKVSELTGTTDVYLVS